LSAQRTPLENLLPSGDRVERCDSESPMVSAS
jgi:hypothetical protein